MAGMPKLVYLWPGLPQLWKRGAWAGLLLACGFAGLLNFLILASLVWTDLLSARLLVAGWGAVVGLCGGSAWLSARGLVSVTAKGKDIESDLFGEAQEHYLRANWFEAETLLNRLLDENARDVDAWLLLATLKRHTGQAEEAAELLEQMERFEDAARWQQEVAREKALLAPLLAPARGGGQAGVNQSPTGVNQSSMTHPDDDDRADSPHWSDAA